MAGYAELRFLVVDDMLTMRKIITQQLKSVGATGIQEANDGDVAWAILQKAAEAKTPIHYIVSDWNMPAMKGVDLLKLCRSSDVYKDVAFLLVTAESEAAQVREAILAGVDNYVIKPFTPQHFQEKLGSVYSKRFGSGR
jgi:two-component system, chemotaxis family, chemotaxis protein CheY